VQGFLPILTLFLAPFSLSIPIKSFICPGFMFIQQALNSAALVSVTTSGITGTYLVINDGVAGFQSSNDLLVNITGYSGTLPALGTIAVSSLFV